MNFQSSRLTPRLLVGGFFLLVAPCHLLAQQVFNGSQREEQQLTDSQAIDAALFDVMFVDRQYGWAVGAHGVIWHTRDGGQHWQLQQSHTECNLRGVWFTDRRRGWAVGGTTKPYSWNSAAVVLHTNDGGQSWQRFTSLIPALETVRFFDPNHGVAVGRSSGGEPFGVFASDDGGQNWRALAPGERSAWLAGDFLDQQTGVVVGDGGRAAQVSAGKTFFSRIDVGARSLRDVRLTPPNGGWLVGDGGLMMQTDDLGQSWQTVDVLPPELAASVDWRSVEVVNDHIWITGSPGSVVLHSPDSGKSWQGHATGVKTPLHQITFVDERTGWAVGSLGTILHTDDGGSTWQEQRRGGERAAVLHIAVDQNTLPWEALTKMALADGYRTTVRILSPPMDSQRQTFGARFSEAASLLGASSGTHSWLFPQPPSELQLSAAQTLATIDRRNDGKTRELLLNELVRQIRLWRPDLLIVPSGNDEPDGLAGLVESVTDDAVSRAADPTSFVRLTTDLDLPPWQVSRVMATLPSNDRGTHQVRADEVAGNTGKLLSDLTQPARGLVERKFSPPPEANEFQLLANHQGTLTGREDDPLAGLGIAPGTAARRALPLHDAQNIQRQRQLAEKRRNLTQIFRAAEGNPAWLAQVSEFTADMDDTSAAQLLFELATQFRKTGQLTLSADTLGLLVRRYPEHPLVDQSLIWLVQFYASGETAHAYGSGTGPVQQALALESPQTVEQASGEELQGATSSQRLLGSNRYAAALQVIEHLAQTRPLLHADPQIRFPWTVVERRRGHSAAADRYLLSLSLRGSGDGWQQCASAENWLRKPDELPPEKPLVRCQGAEQRPHLDGQLNESLWQEHACQFHSAATLQNDVPAEDSGKELPKLFLAYDAEYLYFAARCRNVPGLDYSAEDRPRPYDADLAEHDRIRLCLDVDRDYLTSYQLMVDHRGWTADTCWQDSSWNPRWFVASDGDQKSWAVEVAIPWSALVPQPPSEGDVWALAAERVAPTARVDTLSGGPFDQPAPENFTLLLFE